MKKTILAVVLIATLIGGIVLVSSNALAASATDKNPKASSANNGNNGNGNGVGGNDGTQDNGNGGNNGSNGNGNGNGNNGNNGNSKTNGNNGNGNSGSNGNSNGSNNANNGNGNVANGNNNQNGNAGSNTNGNSGNENGNGNGESGDNGNGNSNGNGNNNANNGNENNGGSNDNSNSNGRYKISGYILDANGNAIVGAEIIFNVPDIVPAQFSDSSGYYEMYAPKGQYKVNVWPPFNSHYIFFEQKILDVAADIQMNIVLQTGSRLSGVITTTSGAPVSGAVVWLSNTAQGTCYFCGWYSKSDGTYFVTAPPGTYTLKIQPKPGLSFPSYTEVITITGDQVRNFVIGNLNNQANTNAHSTTLSITMSYNSLQPGSLLYLSGKLLDQNQNPLADKTIILSYAVANTGTYTPIGSATTDSSGLYKIDWLIPASGTFTLKVDWAGNTEYNPASATTTLTFSAT